MNTAVSVSAERVLRHMLRQWLLELLEPDEPGPPCSVEDVLDDVVHQAYLDHCVDLLWALPADSSLRLINLLHVPWRESLDQVEFSTSSAWPRAKWWTFYVGHLIHDIRQRTLQLATQLRMLIDALARPPHDCRADLAPMTCKELHFSDRLLVDRLQYILQAHTGVCLGDDLQASEVRVPARQVVNAARTRGRIQSGASQPSHSVSQSPRASTGRPQFQESFAISHDKEAAPEDEEGTHDSLGSTNYDDELADRTVYAARDFHSFLGIPGHTSITESASRVSTSTADRLSQLQQYSGLVL